MTFDIVFRLENPPFGTETSERNLMLAAAIEIRRLREALKDIEFVADGKADVDDGKPNDAMFILAVVRTALSTPPGEGQHD